jgi:hypothetical protein
MAKAERTYILAVSKGAMCTDHCLFLIVFLLFMVFLITHSLGREFSQFNGARFYAIFLRRGPCSSAAPESTSMYLCNKWLHLA